MKAIRNMGYVYTTTLSALYTMLFFNGFYYLLIFNVLVATLGLSLDVRIDVLIKGFIIGLSGAFIWDALNLRGFVPFGWIGSLLGLQLTNLIFMLATPYGSMYEKGIGYVVALTFNFLITLIIGSVMYYWILKKLGTFYYYLMK